MIPLIGTVLAALLAGPLAIWMKGRYDKRNTDAATADAARATIAKVTEDRVERLFAEYDRLRSAYRSDIDDLRRQLGESNGRVSSLEREVAEWRAGIRGVVGVWVAVPASVMEYIREHLPDLPPTRFPGERESSSEIH